jgi:hypothetical protein
MRHVVMNRGNDKHGIVDSGDVTGSKIWTHWGYKHGMRTKTKRDSKPNKGLQRLEGTAKTRRGCKDKKALRRQEGTAKTRRHCEDKKGL